MRAITYTGGQWTSPRTREIIALAFEYLKTLTPKQNDKLFNTHFFVVKCLSFIAEKKPGMVFTTGGQEQWKKFEDFVKKAELEGTHEYFGGTVRLCSMMMLSIAGSSKNIDSLNLADAANRAVVLSFDWNSKILVRSLL